MSFGNNYRTEILNYNFETAEEKTAFLSAVIHSIGSLHINKYGSNIEINSDNSQLAIKLIDYLKEIFGIEILLNMTSGAKTYTMSLPGDMTKIIGERLAILKFSGDTPIGLTAGIELAFASQAQMAAYLTGLVVTTSSITIPHEVSDGIYTGGYHFEIDCSNEDMASDILALMAELDIFARKTTRNESYLVYIKDSGMLYDLMVVTGSKSCSKELFAIIYNRSISSNVNRQQNCAIANTDKAIEASEKQIMAISKINHLYGIERLAPKLKELAEFRIKHPDYTLDQIVAEIGGDITKSGVNHRFRKLIDIANNLSLEEDNNGK